MSLSMEEMQKLLTGKEKEKEKSQQVNTKSDSWLNDDELKHVGKAYVNGHKKVSIRGKNYTLTDDNKYKEVLIRPVEGYVPFARVEMEVLRKAR